MRLFRVYKIFFLTLFFTGFSAVLYAEVLVGHVIELKEEEGLVVVKVEETGEPVTVKLSENLLFERPNGSRFPGCVCQENLVHIWGEFKENEPVFQATKIRGSGLHKDPTGVRSRLGKGCRLRGWKKGE